MTRNIIYVTEQCFGPVIGRRAPLLCASSSSSFSTSSSQSPKVPTKPWERSAKLVKNADLTNPYLDQLRAEVVDPSLQLKTIEDELCGAIGKALGRQGEKVLFAIRDMEKEHDRYLEYIQNRALQDALQSAQRHNEARKGAIKARWELLVHRQAVGFTMDNHSVVHRTFHITGALPVNMEEIIDIVSIDGGINPASDERSVEQPGKKVWGDQLAWWKSVGRWK